MLPDHLWPPLRHDHQQLSTRRSPTVAGPVGGGPVGRARRGLSVRAAARIFDAGGSAAIAARSRLATAALAGPMTACRCRPRARPREALPDRASRRVTAARTAPLRRCRSASATKRCRAHRWRGPTPRISPTASTRPSRRPRLHPCPGFVDGERECKPIRRRRIPGHPARARRYHGNVKAENGSRNSTNVRHSREGWSTDGSPVGRKAAR